jgi:phage repressor protein C with HTH and peptisase S24 domain
MSNETIRKRIRQRLAELEAARGEPVSLRSVSLAAGLSEWSVSKILKKEDHSPTLETVEKLAKGLDVSPAWLAFEEEETRARPEIVVMPPPKTVHPESADKLHPCAYVRVDGLVGAGALVEQIDDPSSWDAPDSVAIPTNGDMGALLVRGDSQYPRFFDGEFVLYERAASLPAELVDQYAVVHLDDGRRLLKIVRHGNGDKWLIESLNAAAELVTLLAAHRYLGTIARYADRRPREEGKRAKKGMTPVNYVRRHAGRN